MMDIEAFSEYVWSAENPLAWNKRTGKGILYRGTRHVMDFASPYRVQPKAHEEYERRGRGFTYGT